MSGNLLCCPMHFVWSTSNREPMISPEWQGRLYSYIGGILKKKNSRLIRAGGLSDHIHLLVSVPSTITFGDLVNAIKSNSSRWVHDNFRKSRSFAWQNGYGGFAVSKSLEPRVMNYITNQEKHHRKADFKKEFIALLEKHRVEYDERYLWD
ncbi:MAG TPA: IS200/IS605 family transposase [Blastocatellia bacterium]|nr:IS200/IS605 family transposase [Blastocatellia bacterium]